MDKKLAQELLIETALFYNADRRSKNTVTNECVYQDARGNRCAAGRILIDEALKRIKMDRNNEQVSVGRILDIYGPSVFMEKWRPLVEDKEGQLFLMALQQFHDYYGNWNEKGLSPQGFSRAETIARDYELEVYKVYNALMEFKTAH
jgi:hypothetical protein